MMLQHLKIFALPFHYFINSFIFGHLHLPPINDTTPAVFASKAANLLSGVRTILGQFLEYAFPLSGNSEISFSDTIINSGGRSGNLTLTNPSGNPASVQIAAVDFSLSVFQLITPLPITIAPGSSQSLQFKFDPTETRDYEETAMLKKADGTILYKVRLKGRGTLLPPSSQASFQLAD